MPRRNAHPGVWLVRKNGSWRARWKDPIAKREVTLTLQHATAAERHDWAVRKSRTLASQHMELAHGQTPQLDMPLGDAIQRYLSDCKAEGCRPRTIIAYRMNLERLNRWAEDASTRTLTAERFGQFRSWLLRQRNQSRPGELSPHSVNRALRECKAFAFWLRRQKLVASDRDDFADALRPVKVDRDPRKYFDPPTLRAILSVPGTPSDMAFVAVAMLSGCRVGELLGLRYDGFRPDQHELRIPAAISKTGHGRSLDLTISPALERLLSVLHAKRAANAALFFSVRTNARARDIIHRLVRLGSPPFTFQALRQTAATYLVALRGASWESQQLGHSVVIAEKHYVGLIRHIDRESALELAMRIDFEVRCIRQIN